MQRGFPVQLLNLLRCADDAGELRVVRPVAEAFIDSGAVACATCGKFYQINDGILTLLGADRLHPESAKEMELRDIKNASILSGTRQEWTSSIAESIEVKPTLAAVSTAPGMVVLEIGCGAGRYTLHLVSSAAAVVAADFSRPGLLVLRRKLASEASVALSTRRCDPAVCHRIRVRPRAFNPDTAIFRTHDTGWLRCDKSHRH